MKRTTKQATPKSRLQGSLRAALVAGLVGLAPVSAIAATAPDFGSAVSVIAGQGDTPPHGRVHATVLTPVLSAGLEAPHLSALSDRRIVAGVILVLFAGLSAVTAAMWRELGRQVKRS